MDETSPTEDWVVLMEEYRLKCAGGDVDNDLLELAVRDSKVFIIGDAPIAARQLFDLQSTIAYHEYDIGVDALSRAWADMLHAGTRTITRELLESEGADLQASLVTLADVWHKIVLSDGFFGFTNKEDARTEWVAMYGIGNLFEFVEQDQSLTALEDAFFRNGDKMWDKVWEQRHKLLTEGMFAPTEGSVEIRDMFFITALKYYLSPSHRRTEVSWDKRRATRLAIFCWYHLPPGREVAMLVVDSFRIESEPGFSSNPKRIIQEAWIDQFGAEALMGRICRDLQDKAGTLGIELAPLIRLLEIFCLHPVLRQLFFTFKMYNHILDAMKRQKKEDGEHRRFDWDVWSQGCPLLLWCMNNWFENCVEAIVRNGVVDIVAHGIKLCVGRSCNGVEVYVRMTVKLSASAIVSAELFSDAQHQDALLQILRDDARAVWWPTLRTLRETRRDAPRKEHTRLVNVWIEFGEKTGLKEEVEKRRYESDEGERKRGTLGCCAWAECEFHSKKPPYALRTCAGCNEVRYCAKACQTRDWKEGGHKRRCKRLKG